MSAIPQELTKILDRLKLLNSGIYHIENIFSFDFKHACQEFKVISLNPHWQKPAAYYAEQIQLLIEELLKKRFQIFSKVEYYENHVVEEIGTQEMEDEYAGTFNIVPIISHYSERIKVDDSIRKGWYSKLHKEIIAYQMLVSEVLGIKRTSVDLLSIVDAQKIRSLEVGETKFISADYDSQENFVRFFSEPLLEVEREKLKIKIGCNRKLAAYIFETLHSEGIQPYSLNDIGDSGCFYNGPTPLLAKSLRSDLAKFKKEQGRYTAEISDLQNFVEAYKKLPN
jgi:hypothetical protein